MNAKRVDASLRDMKAEPLTEDDKRRFASRAKLHFWISDMFDRLNRGVSKPAANEARFVKTGNAEIQVELTDDRRKRLLNLRSRGFMIASEKGKSRVVGRISVNKIEALAQLEAVKLILPRI